MLLSSVVEMLPIAQTWFWEVSFATFLHVTTFSDNGGLFELTKVYRLFPQESWVNQ
jgi:hypothetical protein